MIGWDFSNFWNVGRAVLAGANPYTVDFSWYPPATAYLFALFGTVPFSAAYLIWTGINLLLYFHTLWQLKKARQWWIWLLFTPFLFNLLSGQLDIFFLWAARYLNVDPASKDGKTRWMPAIAGAILTLKPQLAAIILPWYLILWLKNDRGLLMRWAGLFAALHLAPLLLNPGIYGYWMTALQGIADKKTSMSGGIFAFGSLGFPVWLLWVLGGALIVWGLTQKEPVSRAAQFSGFPISAWYDSVLLIGSVSGWVLVPFSWLVLGAAYLTESNLPFIAIPFGVLILQAYRRVPGK
jgi:hypothetical protein